MRNGQLLCDRGLKNLHKITVLERPKGFYDALYEEAIIVSLSYTPILDACVVLKGRGITGPLEVYGPKLRAVCDIEKASALRVISDAIGRPVFAKAA